MQKLICLFLLVLIVQFSAFTAIDAVRNANKMQRIASHDDLIVGLEICLKDEPEICVKSGQDLDNRVIMNYDEDMDVNQQELQELTAFLPGDEVNVSWQWMRTDFAASDNYVRVNLVRKNAKLVADRVIKTFTLETRVDYANPLYTMSFTVPFVLTSGTFYLVIDEMYKNRPVSSHKMDDALFKINHPIWAGWTRNNRKLQASLNRKLRSTNKAIADFGAALGNDIASASKSFSHSISSGSRRMADGFSASMKSAGSRVSLGSRKMASDLSSGSRDLMRTVSTRSQAAGEAIVTETMRCTQTVGEQCTKIVESASQNNPWQRAVRKALEQERARRSRYIESVRTGSSIADIEDLGESENMNDFKVPPSIEENEPYEGSREFVPHNSWKSRSSSSSSDQSDEELASESTNGNSLAQEEDGDESSVQQETPETGNLQSWIHQLNDRKAIPEKEIEATAEDLSRRRALVETENASLNSELRERFHKLLGKEADLNANEKQEIERIFEEEYQREMGKMQTDMGFDFSPYATEGEPIDPIMRQLSPSSLTNALSAAMGEIQIEDQEKEATVSRSSSATRPSNEMQVNTDAAIHEEEGVVGKPPVGTWISSVSNRYSYHPPQLYPGQTEEEN